MTKYILFIFILAISGVGTTSCKAKEGCGLEEKYAPDMESKGGKSKLFSKKMSKRMKKKS
ncbi:MAG: hypothetical protein IPM42_06870 [Saprospiraceae bacterium]|nr:hypothetical protein [Saprospiraceae bacterium]